METSKEISNVQIVRIAFRIVVIMLILGIIIWQIFFPKMKAGQMVVEQKIVPCKYLETTERLDTIRDRAYSFREIVTKTGYCMTTHYGDFTITRNGDYAFIDSMKCIDRQTVLVEQYKLRTLQDKTCE